MNSGTVERFKKAAGYLLQEGKEIEGNINAMAAYLAHHQNENDVVMGLLKEGVCREKFQLFHKLFLMIKFFGHGKHHLEMIRVLHDVEFDHTKLSFVGSAVFTPTFTKITLSNQDVLLLPVEDNLVYTIPDLFKII